MNKADLSVIESLETYKDLFDHAHDLIHIVYPDGTILYVNKAWERILGYAQHEVQGHSIYSMVDAEDKQRFVQYRNELMNGTATNKEVVLCLMSKTGKKITVEGFVSVRRQNGVALYTRGIFRDITIRLANEHQLRMMNEALKERESSLQQLLNNAPDAIVVINNKSVITFWNPKAVEMFGWKEKEALGKNLSDTIIPPQYREAHNKGMTRYLATGEAHVLNRTVELSAQNKDGTEFYISLTISNTTQNGHPAFIAFIRNIEKEKQNELELQKQKKQLEQTNEELEQFAYVASHDLQEPLRKIQFYTNTVLDSIELNEVSANYLKKVTESADRMKGLINSLLDFSRLSQTSLRFDKTDLNAVLKMVLSDFELLIQQKVAVVETETLPAIDAIPLQMNQLFFNLIGNALKFSRPDVNPVIKISGSRLTQEAKEQFDHLSNDREYCTISISDNGIGFPEEYVEKIFTVFQRLNQRSQYEGYGIGLAVCQKIVERHKGAIHAQGQPMQGATFTIILPFTQDGH